MMGLLIKSSDGMHDVRVDIEELVSIKGAVFVVNQLSEVPAFIRLQPANSAQVQRYLKENAPIDIPELEEKQEEESVTETGSEGTDKEDEPEGSEEV